MNNYLINPDRYIEQAIYNGPYQRYFTSQLAMSKEGCPWRGTTVCHRCPLSAYSPPVECNYKCAVQGNGSKKSVVDCPHRSQCACGWDQTHKLELWGLIP